MAAAFEEAQPTEPSDTEMTRPAPALAAQPTQPTQPVLTVVAAPQAVEHTNGIQPAPVNGAHTTVQPAPQVESTVVQHPAVAQFATQPTPQQPVAPSQPVVPQVEQQSMTTEEIHPLMTQMQQFASSQQQKWQVAQERKQVLARKRQFGFLAPSALLNLMESVSVLWRQETEERMTSKEMFIEGGLMMVETRLQALRSYGVPEEQLQAMAHKMEQLKSVIYQQG